METKKRASISFRNLIHNSFLEDAKFSSETRTKLNLKNIIRVFLGLLVVFVVVILCNAPDESKRNVAPAKTIPDFTKPGTATAQKAEGTQAAPYRASAPFGGSGIGYGTYSNNSGGGKGSRSRSAAQVIRRGAGGNDPGAQIPMGTMIRATLLNTVRSTNTASPVIALITQDVANDSGTSIPANTKVIGNATFDDASRRIQIRFSTLIYEDGSQHGIQATAMMQDGSAGIDGDYHSGRGEQQAGRFIGNFIGGLADGLRTQTTPGMFGNSTQEGSIKNGLLNGVSLSAQDQAKAYSDDLTNTRPSMSIDAGSPFFLFLDKEYLP